MGSWRVTKYGGNDYWERMTAQSRLIGWLGSFLSGKNLAHLAGRNNLAVRQAL